MELKKVWNIILSEIELQVSRPIFAAFFSKTKLTSLKDGLAEITVVNPLVKEIIESRYQSLIRNLFEKHAQKSIKLVFKVGDTLKTEGVPGPLFITPSPNKSFDNLIEQSRLNFSYSFENFAVSSSNQLAYAAARAVVQSPGVAYNPLFLYGGVGVGKTHLMQAIGIDILKKNKNMRVIFATGEEFTNEIIEAIRLKTTQKFKNKFRSAQVLLIDDVQFIAGKNTVQEEFFYTFNAIHRLGGQIVLTSDKPPSEISKLEERLRSRFEGGLLIDIQPPDFELRTAIVLIKAKQRGIDLPMSVAQELANQISDARRLEGSLIRLLTESEVRKEPISLSLVRRLFGNKPSLSHQPLSFSPLDYLSAVSRFYGVKTSLLKGERRLRPIVFPRQVLMYLLKTDLNLSLNEIGSLLGGRDHTTILHGIEKISSLLSKDNNFRRDVLLIKRSLGMK